MSLGRRFVSTGAGDAVCLTESVQVFGADSTYSSNKLLYQFENNVTNDVGSPSATNSGATFSSTAKFGSYSADFAGTTEHIDTGYNTDDSSLTHSFWMYQHSITGSYNSILGTYWDGGSGVYGYYLWSDNGTTINWRVHTSNSAYVQVTGNVSLNTWHHVVLTWSDGEGAGIYIDGVLAQFTASSLARQKNDETITLANLDTRGTSTVGYDGLLDQYRYYNKSITAQDVATLYAETDSTTSNTNLFNEGAGVALYSLDYDASEASGYYDGTPTDVIFGVSGKTLYGARFNGSTSEITASNFASLSQVGISMWVNMPDISQQAGLIARYGTYREFAIYMYSGNLTASIYYNGNNGNATTITASTYMSNDTWHHIAYTANGSTAPKLYIDNVEVGTPQHTDAAKCAYYTSSEPLDIGHFAGISSYNYEGKIDQVRVFSQALSTGEISNLWNGGNGEIACVHTATANTADYPSGTTTVAHFPLDNNTFDNKSTNDATSETDIEYRFGKYGQAAVFNGSSSQIITGYTPPATTTATISLWVNWKAYTNAFAILAADNNTGTTANSFFTLATGGSGYGGNGYLWVSIGNGSSIDIDHTIPFDDHGGLGNWIHVAVTVSGTSVNIYMNGYKTKSYTSTVSYAPSGSGYAYRLGYTTGWSYFDGKLDQVRFYSTELSSNQILELYNEKPETDTSNLKTTLYSGDNVTTGNYVSNVGFQPDLVWIKPTSTSGRHLMHNVITGTSVYEGAGLTLHTNETFTSNTYGEFTSFEANGFIVQFSSGSQYFNNSGRDYVAWNWKAGGTAVQNNDGTIQGANCQVSANSAAGFSIVKYTGNGTDGATVGHALSSAPEIIIIKNLDSSSTNWMVKVPSIMTDDKNYLYLNDDAAVQTTSSTTFIKTVNSSIFTLGTSSQTNSTNDFIAYCWHSVSGYSKIGGYAGSGNSQTIYVTNDGTSSGSGGFKPSWVIIKNRTAGSSNWMIYDAVRDTDGTLSEFLEANTPDQETTASSATITPISNGFTIGNSNSLHLNDSTDNYIYMAFK